MKGIKKLFAAIIAVTMILACLPSISTLAETQEEPLIGLNSKDNYNQLALYIQNNGTYNYKDYSYRIIKKYYNNSGDSYFITMSLKNDSIIFEYIDLTSNESSEIDFWLYFTLDGENTSVPFSFSEFWYKYGDCEDIATKDGYFNIAKHSSSSYYNLNSSGKYISNESFSEFFTLITNLLLYRCDNYLRYNLGFDLSSLGFYAFSDEDGNFDDLIYENGNYYYVVNGVVKDATTLCKYGNTLFYIENGKINFNATTLCNYGGTWYYVEKGKVNLNKTTLCNYGGTWYYVKNGKVDWKCDTLCNYGGTWYYVKNGKVDWKCDTLCKYGGTWYYAKNGKVDWKCDTLCKYGGTWYYAKNGKVNWKSDTLCKYGGTWYYAKNGKVDWNCNTLCKYGNTWYYVQKGKVNWNATTLCKYGNAWYYVQKGKVNWNATTLCKYGKTWYYVEKGKVNFKANRSFNYYGKSYNVRNGVVIF